MTFQVATNVLPGVQSTKIAPKGSPAERIWIIAESPLAKDKDKGYLFSSPMGWSYDKLLTESGIIRYYCTYFNSDAEAVALCEQYQPPIIVVLDRAGETFCGQIRSRDSVNLWAGSLLKSDKLSYPHYIIPTFGPEACIADWAQRQIVKCIDYGKVKSELEYWQQYGILQPLPRRQLSIDSSLPYLLHQLKCWTEDSSIEIISVDIESVYPKEKSQYFGHPGYPVTCSIAISPEYGTSFSMFQETNTETRELWKALCRIFWEKKVLGQNYMEFDDWILGMLGMPAQRLNIIDTKYRHAVLWPELSHKLEFMTRQYTREPYYKQEGHHWNMKDLSRLKRYNALDTTVTYEVYLAQEEEFNERPHLRE